MTASIVVDNSIVMAWCFEDEESTYADAVMSYLIAQSAEAAVPGIWPLEASNVLLVAERRKRIKTNEVFTPLDLLERLPVLVMPESPGRVFREIFILARKHALSTYDASYLDLAIRLSLPLATLDTALLKAAKKCAVPIFDPKMYSNE
jgi:predicted nucleic acid-binding protein